MEPRKVIFDTDIGADCDDVVALDLLISAHKQGLCELVGVSCTSMDLHGAGCARVVLAYRGMEQVPVYARPQRKDWPQYYGDVVSLAFPELAQMERPFPDSISGLRKMIRDNPGVCIVVVGDSTNMADLLRSEADDISPLNGVELVRQNVSFLAVMAGSFDWQENKQDWGHRYGTPEGKTHAEYNVVCDIPACAVLVDLCPVEVYFLPFEAGVDCMTGRIIAAQGRECPDGLAIIAHESGETGRESWDPMTALFAVWGTGSWFALSQPGKIRVDETGVTHHVPCEKGKQFYLKLVAAPERIAETIEQELGKLF